MGPAGGLRQRRTRWSLGLAALLVPVFVTGPPAHATTPGLNGKIACSTNATDLFGDIVTMNPDGSNQTPFLPAPGAVDTAPAWSPDGRKLAWSSTRDSDDFNFDIWVANADGTGLKNLTNHPAFDFAPSWSPDGSQIAFVSMRADEPPDAFAGEIFVMNAYDGSGVTRLNFNNPGQDSLPDWSPDNTQIVWNSNREGVPNHPAGTQLYSITPYGTDEKPLTNAPGSNSSASWAPDGKQIAFHSNRDGDFDIYVMNPDGSGQTNITNNTDPDTFPSWSPDGQRILFTSNRGEGNEVYTMNIDGSGVTRLTNNTYNENLCAWQPLCTIYGSGNIVGTGGNDVICGSEGDDAIAGGGGHDTIMGLGGNDRIAGGSGDDRIFGGIGSDQITGDAGTDLVDGGFGADLLDGGDGVDRVDGGPGNDACFAGEPILRCP